MHMYTRSKLTNLFPLSRYETAFKFLGQVLEDPSHYRVKGGYVYKLRISWLCLVIYMLSRCFLHACDCLLACFIFRIMFCLHRCFSSRHGTRVEMWLWTRKTQQTTCGWPRTNYPTSALGLISKVSRILLWTCDLPVWLVCEFWICADVWMWLTRNKCKQMVTCLIHWCLFALNSCVTGRCVHPYKHLNLKLFFSAFAQTHVLYSFQSLHLTIPTTFIHFTKHFCFPSHMEHQNVHIKEKQMHMVK